ncbi:hypothetical protein BCU68_09530 [Vibrio sp. 10N.286.49.B3]|uniref:putative ATP-dependent zinc protease n=1 Tax=Vibrio sp. 10N.286.49.B3 TaxID=1880855 RepID=UPI000C84739D|nr:RimK/LysX family protein [Vibrio sp. 10N.286.49.B3]PMH46019.1 hypothetical protein BCU68_09530 [Vibrio sp. 10N.286.49.B3]
MNKGFSLLGLTLSALLGLTAQATAQSTIYSTQNSAYPTQNSAYSTQNPAYELEDKVVLGRLENVYLGQIKALNNLPFMGKIDTGADTTSMHANNIYVSSDNPKYQNLTGVPLMAKIIDEHGGPASNWWHHEFDNEDRQFKLKVNFTLTHPYSGKVIPVELPLNRISVVRSRTSEVPLYRPVINIPMTIAGTTVNTDVSLTDRSNFSAPILIGKTFLKDNAWVMAGYDYLQEQKEALVIGRHDSFHIDGLQFDTSFSFTNKHSILHATNIKQEGNKVAFTTRDAEGKTKRMSLPLAGVINFGNVERLQVYVPVQFHDEPVRQMLVYLKDRSDRTTQLRLGLNNLNRYFMVSTNDKYGMSDKVVRYSQLDKRDSLVISPQETLNIEGVNIPAVASFTVQTSVLKVRDFAISKGHGTQAKQVTYYLDNDKGEEQRFVKPLVKNIRVGEEVRPIVTLNFALPDGVVSYDVALSLLNDDETQSELLIGKLAAENGVFINTRTTDLLKEYPITKAGYIETASVEGLDFPVKLDTGADVSSMNALNIKHFTRDNKPMVSFDYQNDSGLKQHFEREVVDTMTIRAKAGEQANHRPVVMMRVKLGDIEDTIRVNLQDRSRFHYSMILGKNFLREGLVVSSDEQYRLTTPLEGELEQVQ